MMNSNERKLFVFIPCLVDGFYPEIGAAVLRVFEKLGLEVVCPTDQTCCGQVAFNAGQTGAARKAAQRFLTVFAEAGTVVCPSGSCVKMVRRHYPELLKDEADWRARARSLAGRIYEFSEYLVDVLKVGNIPSGFQGKAAYHDSCSLYYGLGIRGQPRRLLQGIAGLELIEIKSAGRCCGFGGGFALKHADLSLAMAGEKMRDVLETGADTLVAAEPGCLLNLEGLIRRQGHAVRCLHLAQVLAA